MRITAFGAWAMMLLLSGQAWAEDAVAGKPVPYGTGFQRAVTPIAHDIHWLDNMLLWVIGLITLFVTVLLVIVAVRFNKKANPTPARFTHHALLEVVWTAIPVVILVIVAIPSLRLLFNQLDIPQADVTIKATGNQWYWSYEYPDEGVSFDAFMLARDELAAKGYSPDEYLLAADSRVVVPVGKVVHVLVTGADVLHAWTVPSFGVKTDAVPGRMNENWFRADEVGVYFGQCSELCGKDHSFMPIVVEVKSEADYAAWLAQTKTAQGIGTTDVANAATGALR